MLSRRRLTGGEVALLRRPGVVIDHPEVVAKSYPGFWRDLQKIV